MRSDRRNYQLVIPETLEEQLCSLQRVAGRLGVGNREPDHRLPENPAHAALLRGLGNHVLEVVHVGVRSRSRQQHLRASEPGAPANKVGTNVLRFRRKDELLKPVLEPQVVRDAA